MVSFFISQIHLEFILLYGMRDRFNFHLVPYDYTVILIMLPTKKSSFPHTNMKCCGDDGDDIDVLHRFP